MPLQGNSKKRKPLIWNRTFTLYLKILIIDKKRVYDDDIWKSQCLPPDSAGEGWIFLPWRIVAIIGGVPDLWRTARRWRLIFKIKLNFSLNDFPCSPPPPRGK